MPCINAFYGQVALVVSISICLNLYIFILKKIFQQFWGRLAFNSDTLSATSFMIISEKNYYFYSCFSLLLFNFFHYPLVVKKSSIIDRAIFQEILKDLSVVLFTFKATHLHITDFTFCSQCISILAHHLTLFSICSIFPNLSKVSIKAKYISGKTYVK